MKEGLHAAFTAVDITPDQNRGSANGNGKERSYPVYDPLRARILLLQDGANTAAIVAVDSFELGIGFDAKVAAALQDRGIAPFPTLFCPSHIGSTPISNYGAYIMIFAQDLIIENYEDEICSRIAEGIQEAFEMLVPVRMASRGGHAPDVCYNRRFIKPDGTVHMVFNRQESPPEPEWVEQGKDDEVSVLRFDYVGRRGHWRVHQLWLPCALLNGQVRRHLRRLSLAMWRMYSARLRDCPLSLPKADWATWCRLSGMAWRPAAWAALWARKRSMSLSKSSLTARRPWARTCTKSRFRRAGYRKSRKRCASTSRPCTIATTAFLYEWYEQNPSIRYPIKVVTLGDTALVHMPGELFHDTALAIKGASPFRHTVVISRPTREVAYVPTPEAFDQGGMEPNLAAIAPSSEPLIRQAAIDLLAGLREPVAV